MSGFDLKGTHKSVLRKASRRKIEEYFINLPASVRSVDWLRESNRYRYRCISRYSVDLQATPSRVNHRQLMHYVGASAPTHVIDGWSCLGRAVDATLRGDPYSATHFGYYAELRAAMSLLSSEGIGVFLNRHPIIDDAGATQPFPKAVPTHKVIWPILKYWATLKRAADLLDDLVSPRSIRLSNWLTGTAAKIPVRAVAQHWLASWGLDLAVADDDHSSRNLASYRPSEFRRPPPPRCS